MVFATTEPSLARGLNDLAARAAWTIRAHDCQSGTCVACGQPSPCDQAILAAHNLELVSPSVPYKRCDNRSVGVIITDGAGRYLVFDRSTFPPGTAACAGHVDDHGSDEAAAHAEVREELGLVVDGLALLTRGWRDNPCSRLHGPKGQGHEWTVYVATARGSLLPSPRETRNTRWVSRAQLGELCARTLGVAKGAVSLAAFEATPGLEPVWVLWFVLTGALSLTDTKLRLLDELSCRFGQAIAEG